MVLFGFAIIYHVEPVLHICILLFSKMIECFVIFKHRLALRVFYFHRDCQIGKHRKKSTDFKVSEVFHSATHERECISSNDILLYLNSFNFVSVAFSEYKHSIEIFSIIKFFFEKYSIHIRVILLPWSDKMLGLNHRTKMDNIFIEPLIKSLISLHLEILDLYIIPDSFYLVYISFYLVHMYIYIYL